MNLKSKSLLSVIILFLIFRGGMMESFQASVASVKSFSVDSFDPVEMKLYRKLRGVAVNFCLDEKYLDDKCALSVSCFHY